MRGGLLAVLMLVALVAGAIVIISLVRVPDMYAIEGRAEVTYTPDRAEITSSIYAESDLSLDAVEEAASTMREILAALKTAGVDTADIKTADVRSGLLDLNNEQRATDKKRYYYAEQIVIVQVRDIKTIGKILDAIARAGSNYWLVQYKVRDEAKFAAAARKAAFTNALEIADAYAANGQFKRGRVLKIQDDAVRFPEVSYTDRDYRMHREGRSGAHRGSVEKVVVTGSRVTPKDTTFDIPPPREQTVEATTQVLFEIE